MGLFQNKSKLLIIIITFIFVVSLSIVGFAATTEEFVDNLTEGYNNQSYLVEKENNRKFIIRPFAEQVGTDYTNIELNFRSVSTPPDTANIELRYEGGGLAPNGDSSTNIDWIDNDGEVRVNLNLSWLRDSLDNGSYDIMWGGVVLAKIELRPVEPAPIIEANLTNYEEYTDLSSSRIYYLNADQNAGDFQISNSNNIDRIRYRYENSNLASNYTQSLSIESKTYSTSLAEIDDDWVDPSTNGVASQSLWNSYWLVEDNIPSDIRTKLEELEDNNNLNFTIIRVIARNYGAAGATARSYYIVEDADKPQINVLDKDGTEKTNNKFDSYQTRRPQLKANIADGVSGINSEEDITAEIIPLPAGNDEDNLPGPTAFSNADQMEVIGLSERDNAGKQTATFVPYSELGEGEYAVRIKAEDKAGNKSQDHGDAPFIFYLEINQTEPIINNVSFNNKIIDTETTEEQPVNADALDLYYEAYGAQDLVYGIKYKGSDGTVNDNDWFLLTMEDISYVTQYQRTNFLTHPDVGSQIPQGDQATNGVYEVVIIADEKNMDLSAIQDNTAADSDIDTLKQETEQRSYVEFMIEVDGNPPDYQAGSLEYFDSYPNSTITLAEGSTEPINEGQPIFTATFTNASEIKQDDIDIYFENQDTGRRISGQVITRPEVIDRDDGTTEHIIEFQPVISLDSGIYNLEITATDVFSNSVKVADPFLGIFEIVTSGDGYMDFSIQKGARLNVNQSSALEIQVPKNEGLDPTDSLRITLNGAPIVEQGDKIVDDRSKNAGEEGRYREGQADSYLDDPSYYKDDDYQAEGFDVMFFDDKHRIIIFARRPLPSGRNKIQVEVVDENGVLITDQVEFMVDNYRHGFGFGRLLIDSSE